jgi:hypothetical protein
MIMTVGLVERTVPGDDGSRRGGVGEPGRLILPQRKYGHGAGLAAENQMRVAEANGNGRVG